ncbi:hypothetical protein AJ85_08005 [Alkalihalobacillus alcalophilus ATCC 27647 = CGMCC 1.3604]|uniref:Uncharacterized protein n=1 Tax=Alkalihalobacillus alcalophilus ATCC 27647 = CGMCC 1.3604 TaxID=1218173 RepID=A0A4S4K4F7_ALKAL|nr:hypothetical protein AJ85_08005 [Alkalihalobacillus alcalophilus ATCC 27647 = CGMCC 1.3604]
MVIGNETSEAAGVGCELVVIGNENIEEACLGCE